MGAHSASRLQGPGLRRRWSRKSNREEDAGARLIYAMPAGQGMVGLLPTVRACESPDKEKHVPLMSRIRVVFIATPLLATEIQIAHGSLYSSQCIDCRRRRGSELELSRRQVRLRVGEARTLTDLGWMVLPHHVPISGVATLSLTMTVKFRKVR